MYKTISVLVCLLFLLFANFQKASANSWSKSGSVVFINSSAWNSQFNRTPSVLFQNNQYRMWYDGYDGSTFRIGYAYSTDGITWNNLQSPVLDGSSKNQDYNEPFVLYDNNKYKMWFLTYNKSSGATNISYSESADGIIWNEPTVSLVPTEPWEINFIAHPHVIKDQNQYKLYYSGQSGNGIWKIGYAESINGINWTKFENNPILSPNADENPTVAGTFILRENSVYTMYYHSKNPATNIRSAISSDGINWERENVILSSTPNNFDSVAMISPSIVRVGNHYKLFYSGYNGSTWKIGYATKTIETPSVPLLKQTSNPWQSQVYDHANVWSPKNSTIYRWGCAVTSLAMVLNYHGYLKLPNDQPLNPGTLNTWLKSQSDGYVESGLVNWHAISRLSKQAKSVNSITNFDALEFSYGGSNKNILTQDLENNNPAILEIPGHFIVATAVEDNTFLINDPYYDRTKLNEGYGNTFTSTRRYIPSNTDLSYFMIVSDPSITITIKSGNGTTVSENIIQNPIQDPESNLKSGKPMRVTYVPKPTNGNYTIHLHSQNTKQYNFPIYLYDENGEVVEKNLSGVTHQNTNVFSITFNKTDLTKIVVKKTVTHSSILKDLDAAYKNKLIHIGMYISLKQMIINSQNDYNRKSIFTSKIHLYTAIQLAQSPAKLLNNSEYSNILISDLNILYSSL
ncbi:MAG TPA: C39 family peptidase [Candidatus Woesebacteria bacterium]|nr:C39 family peptidase [Candidatus Woesebacteria bacterium]